MEDKIRAIVQKYNGTFTTDAHNKMWEELYELGIGGISLNNKTRQLDDMSIKIIAPLQDINGNDTEFTLVMIWLEREFNNEYTQYLA